MDEIILKIEQTRIALLIALVAAVGLVCVLIITSQPREDTYRDSPPTTQSVPP